MDKTIKHGRFRTLMYVSGQVRKFLNDARNTKGKTYQQKIDYWHKSKPSLEEFELHLVSYQRVRMKIFPFLLRIIKLLKIAQGGKNVVLNYHPKTFEDAVILCPTHDESIDYERITAVINRHTVFFHNEPEALYGTVNDLFLCLNVHICFDAFDREDRRLALAKMIAALKLGDSICIYPEGVLNYHPSVIVNHPYLGSIIAALETGKTIVPWGYESYGKQAWHNQGEAFDVADYIKNLKTKYQNMVANDLFEEKGDDLEADLLNYYADKKIAAQKLGSAFSYELNDFDFNIIAAYKLRDTLATLKWGIWEEKQRRDLIKRNPEIDAAWHQLPEDKKSMLIAEQRGGIPADYWQKVVDARIKHYPYEDEILTDALVNKPYDREDDVFNQDERVALKLGLDPLLSQINLKQTLLKLDDETLEASFGYAITMVANKKPKMHMFDNTRTNLQRMTAEEVLEVITQ